MILGFLGIILLVGPTKIIGGTPIDSAGAALLIIGSLSWAVGSLYSIRSRFSSSPLMGSSMQMLAGGAFLYVAASLAGEWSTLSFGGASLRSLMSLAYLIIFGSLVAINAYMWLLKVSNPAWVSTYAFINPVVAVFLGWALGGESLTTTTLMAASIIIVSVFLVTIYRTRSSPVTDPSKEP